MRSFIASFDGSPTIDQARSAGYRCALDGPNTKNCHFSFFGTKELTAAWEAGKRKGEAERKSRRKRGEA